MPATSSVDLNILSNLCHFGNGTLERKIAPKLPKFHWSGATARIPCTAELHGEHNFHAFSPSPNAAKRIPYSSQPMACFLTVIIQLGGGDEQVQMLDSKKPNHLLMATEDGVFDKLEPLFLCQETLAHLLRKDLLSTQVDSH